LSSASFKHGPTFVAAPYSLVDPNQIHSPPPPFLAFFYTERWWTGPAFWHSFLLRTATAGPFFALTTSSPQEFNSFHPQGRGLFFYSSPIIRWIGLIHRRGRFPLDLVQITLLQASILPGHFPPRTFARCVLFGYRYWDSPPLLISNCKTPPAVVPRSLSVPPDGPSFPFSKAPLHFLLYATLAVSLGGPRLT